MIAEKLEANASTKIIRVEDGVPQGWKILDIGSETIGRFKERLVEAKTIFGMDRWEVLKSKPLPQAPLELHKRWLNLVQKAR